MDTSELNILLSRSTNAPALLKLSVGDLAAALSSAKTIINGPDDVQKSVLKAFVQFKDEIEHRSIPANVIRKIRGLFNGLPTTPFSIRFQGAAEGFAYIGELTLLTLALEAGKLLPEVRLGAANQALILSTTMAGVIEEDVAKASNSSTDSAIFAAGAHLRGWASLLSEFYGNQRLSWLQGQSLHVKAKVTNCTMSQYPQLVGESMVQLGKWYETQGALEAACKHYDPFILDAEWILQKYANTTDRPIDTDALILAHFKEACAGYIRCGGAGRSKNVSEKLRIAEQITMR